MFPLPLLQQMCWRWRPPLYLFITHRKSNINKPQAASFRFPKHHRQPSYSSHDDFWIRLKWWCTDLHGALHQARHLFFPLFSSRYAQTSSEAAVELELAEFSACPVHAVFFSTAGTNHLPGTLDAHAVLLPLQQYVSVAWMCDEIQIS